MRSKIELTLIGTFNLIVGRCTDSESSYRFFKHARNCAWLPTLMGLSLVLAAGCGTIPNVNAALHTDPTYLVEPSFVGPHGVETQEQAREVVARLKENQKIPTDLLGRHMVVEQALSDVPLVLGNKVTLLENAKATFDAMLTAIRGAKNSINIEMYIFDDGPIGQMFADALIERQRHGVQVNIMYDGLGSFLTPASFFDKMHQSGIALLEYRPLDPFEATLGWSFGHRNHRKMVVVDGRIAFTGGINISEVYASGLRSSSSNAPLSSWRDTDIEIEGPVVAEFQHIFIGEWQYQKGPPLNKRDYFPKIPQAGEQIVRVIGSIPERFSLIYVVLISAIENSESNVYITDAYFSPDRQLLRALENAARQGVDVRLLLPSESDEPFVVSAQRSHYKGLLKAGIKIYEWKGKMLHAKTATIDGVWSTVGTSNLDWWSIARDNELNAIILSHSFGDQMNLMFKNDMESSNQVEPEQWEQRGFYERVKETFASAIAPLL
ncbi:MAG TPA: phospholipase D-like domain-containing protein [Candidatus Binataceae bacterium]|nr:phospholipase D-like domain-containing protein [Candidatus Binataceae bacterium]